MTPSGYTEDDLVQKTAAEYLEKKLGLRPKRPGVRPESLLGRAWEVLRMVA